MGNEAKYIKVLWLKGHWDYGYFAGQNGIVDSRRAPELLKGGFIIPLPDEKEEKVNPLPEDMPLRAKLFELGFDTIEKVREAGKSLLDEGISNTSLKKISAYLKDK